MDSEAIVVGSVVAAGWLVVAFGVALLRGDLSPDRGRPDGQPLIDPELGELDRNQVLLEVLGRVRRIEAILDQTRPPVDPPTDRTHLDETSQAQTPHSGSSRGPCQLPTPEQPRQPDPDEQNVDTAPPGEASQVDQPTAHEQPGPKKTDEQTADRTHLDETSQAQTPHSGSSRGPCQLPTPERPQPPDPDEQNSDAAHPGEASQVDPPTTLDFQRRSENPKDWLEEVVGSEEHQHVETIWMQAGFGCSTEVPLDEVWWCIQGSRGMGAGLLAPLQETVQEKVLIDHTSRQMLLEDAGLQVAEASGQVAKRDFHKLCQHVSRDYMDNLFPAKFPVGGGGFARMNPEKVSEAYAKVGMGPGGVRAHQTETLDTTHCLGHQPHIEAMPKPEEVVLPETCLEGLHSFQRAPELKRALFLLLSHSTLSLSSAPPDDVIEGEILTKAHDTFTKALEIFAQLESDEKAGTIDSDSFWKALRASGVTKIQAECILYALEEDDSRHVHWRDFIAAVLCSTLRSSKALAAIAFTALDQDEDGEVSDEELLAALAKKEEQDPDNFQAWKKHICSERERLKLVPLNSLDNFEAYLAKQKGADEVPNYSIINIAATDEVPNYSITKIAASSCVR